MVITPFLYAIKRAYSVPDIKGLRVILNVITDLGPGRMKSVDPVAGLLYTLSKYYILGHNVNEN